MAANTFLIGAIASSDPDDWSVVTTLLSSVSSDITSARALEWEHNPFAVYKTLGNLESRGYGLPVVRWKFGALRTEQRENLRDFISGTTTELYIRTSTNETVAGVRVWKDYRCLAKWVQRPELVYHGDNVMQVEILFERCIDVTA